MIPQTQADHTAKHSHPTSRRAFLAGAVGTAVGLAGCGSQQSETTDAAVSDGTATTATRAENGVAATATPADQSGTTTPVDLASLPFRLQVSDDYEVGGIGTVLTGVVRTGVLRVGDTISIQPVDITSRVTRIDKENQEITEARPGDHIGFAARGVRRDEIFPGVVCGPEDAPPTVALRFRAAVEVLPPATEENEIPDAAVVRVGDAFSLHHGPLQEVCRLAVVDSVTRAGSSSPPETNVKSLEFGDSATVTLLPEVPLAIEVETAFPGLGTFVMRDENGRTVAYGMVVDVLSR